MVSNYNWSVYAYVSHFAADYSIPLMIKAVFEPFSVRVCLKQWVCLSSSPSPSHFICMRLHTHYHVMIWGNPLKLVDSVSQHFKLFRVVHIIQDLPLICMLLSYTCQSLSVNLNSFFLSFFSESWQSTVWDV